MAESIELWLPFPVSANRLWVKTRNGMRKSDAYTAWLLEAGLEVRRQRPQKISGPYKITITAARPDHRRRDIDNTIKSVSDLLQSVGVIRDDCDCEMVTARWVTSGDGVAVRIEQAGTEA